MKNTEGLMLIDQLIEKVIEKKNPCIIGLDPVWEKIPECYKDDKKSRCECILSWHKDIINCISRYIVAIKPQNAFYEVYGSEGIRLYEETIRYAQNKGLIVIDDSKRNDIGNTTEAYAYAHLSPEGPINADFLTICPFLGKDSMEPFIRTAKQYDKGLFILVRTTNEGAKDIQDAITSKGISVSQSLAMYIHEIAQETKGKYGYSSIGAVVAGTYPEEAKKLRKIMPNNILLVPGFGEQGANAKDVLPCFTEEGLGALVNSSRGVLYAYLKMSEYKGTKESYLNILEQQIKKMRNEVYEELKKNCNKMVY